MTSARAWRRRSRAQLGDRGGISVYVAICTVALLGIIGLVVDGAGKLRATERADAVAIEAARAAGQAIDGGQAVPGDAIVVDPDAARAAARSYLKQAGVPGAVSVSADGRTLTVTINTSYETKFLPVVGIGSMSVRGHGKAQLVHGIDSPEE